MILILYQVQCSLSLVFVVCNEPLRDSRYSVVILQLAIRSTSCILVHLARTLPTQGSILIVFLFRLFACFEVAFALCFFCSSMASRALQSIDFEVQDIFLADM